MNQVLTQQSHANKILWFFFFFSKGWIVSSFLRFSLCWMSTFWDLRMWPYWEIGSLKTWNWSIPPQPSEGINPTDIFILDFQAFRTVTLNTFVLFKSPSLWYSVMADLADCKVLNNSNQGGQEAGRGIIGKINQHGSMLTATENI